MTRAEDDSAPRRLQLHIVQPYKIEVREHHRVRGYLEQGYEIEQLQRVSDREILITLKRA